MTNVFLLLMTVVFMLFEVQLLPYKLQRALDKPNEGLAAMRRR